ncbi:MAG: dephospho-CoA kinase [Candidatus Gracilibacteria bacterium]|nr:dephospho-CoA kinase [Candidatus Gracilibacteria bacterium]
MIIGLTGTIAAGKGTLVNYFKEKGFTISTMSDIIKVELDKRLLENTRDNFRVVGNSLREEFGAGILVKKIIENNQNKDLVIDGIRSIGEVEELKKHENSYLISIDAPIETRFKWMIERGKESDPKTFELFIEADKKNNGNWIENTGIEVLKCMEKSDFNIYNDGSLENLSKKIEEIINKILI